MFKPMRSYTLRLNVRVAGKKNIKGTFYKKTAL